MAKFKPRRGTVENPTKPGPKTIKGIVGGMRGGPPRPPSGGALAMHPVGTCLGYGYEVVRDSSGRKAVKETGCKPKVRK